jgi:linoleoyl-CoA desaturase
MGRIHMASEAKIHFVKFDSSDFYITLKERVKNHFKKNGITPYANSFMIFKIFFFLAGFIGTYLFLLLGNLSILGSYSLWIMLGLFTAFVGVNICHDAVHGAISRNQKVNTVLGYLFNIAGTNAYIWKLRHNQIHHTYTNIQDFDGDINITPLIRMSPHQKLRKIHRYQHWYSWFLYCLTSLSWVFIGDYKKFFGRKIVNHKLKKPPTHQYFSFLFFKAFYYSTFLVVPIIFIDLAWWHILLGFVAMHLIEGFCLAIMIQMAHLLEGLDFPVPNKKGEIENSWAIHQLSTTADFARKNPLVAFFFGGLNFHIEHHLFQRICHVHHPQISHIIKRTAKEFSIPYNEFITLKDAFNSHQKFLRIMGRNI